MKIIVCGSPLKAGIPPRCTDMHTKVIQGRPGPQGEAATVEVVKVVTIEPNEPARVENIGDENNAKFVLYIPKGDPGNRGEAGKAATIEAVEVVTIEPDEPARVEDIGDENNVKFVFYIPKGEKGAEGDPGPLRTVNGIAPDENGNIELSDIEALKKQVADLMYDPIAINSFALSVTKAEMGSTVNSLTATWSLNKEPVSQTLDGTVVAADKRSATLSSLGLTASKTFTLDVTDERAETATKTATLSFMNGVYYGVLEDGAAITSAAINALTKNLQTSKSITFTANAGKTQRVAYALPARYGTPSFKVGGFDGGFNLAETINFTNASGYAESYNVWLSDNTGLGSTTVVVS